ncbi:CarD family transcriptional regulator [soil metagenome]|nr:CarD family transcriptional regulator [Actinomycetota bacterium]MDQ3216753.1 CarD family transcriptional regulator [Actinomycetota bacterium]
MRFDVGDKVVYPHHGAAVVEKVEQRELMGEEREYYILKLAYGELTLMVPTDSTEEVGIREITPAREMPKVFKVLKKNEPTTNTTNWSRRFKANVEKLRSGDIYQVAEVVRSLHRRDREKGLSAGEKRMLTKARQILVSELTFAQGCDEDEAEQLLDEVLG